MWDWFYVGETTKGVLIGGAITLVGTVMSQILVGWLQARQFKREAKENREVMSLQHEREDEVADRAQRIWVSQQMWERRIDAYETTLRVLSQIESGFQRTMNHALNPTGDESEQERRRGLEQAQEGMDTLAQPSLYLNDRALKVLSDMRKEILDANQDLRDLRASKPKDADMRLGAVGVMEAKKAIKAVRLEGQEHLGDKQKSLANVMEDASKLSLGQ